MNIRDKHLTLEEIMKYMDASDISEKYMLWLEEASEHILTCGVCQEKLNRAMTADSVCDEEGLFAGLDLMEHEEEIRKDILIAHLLRMQEQARIKELIGHIRSGYVERFTFGMENLQRSVCVARGDKPQRGQRVTLERVENKLILKIPGEMGKGSRTGTEEIRNKGLPRKLTVILCIDDGESIVKEALWNNECGQYTATVDEAGLGDKVEVNVIF